MNRKRIAEIAAAMTALGLVVFFVAKPGTDTQALTVKQTATYLLNTSQQFPAPAVGFCADYLLAQAANEDDKQASDHYRVCTFPAPDAGWTEQASSCYAPDGSVCGFEGECICPDATVLIPPVVLTPSQEAQADLDRRCHKAAVALCDSDAGLEFKRNQCIQAAEEACQGKAREAGTVAWKSPEYPITDQTKAVDRIPRKQVFHGCACAPEPVYDAGGTRCKEWQTWPELDGGDWKNAVPGHVIEDGLWKGQQCQPIDCTETWTRRFAGDWKTGTMCEPPADTGPIIVDAGI